MNESQQMFLASPGLTPSQETLIYELLLAQKGAWVPLPELSRHSGSLSVATRISCLNKKRDALNLPRIIQKNVRLVGQKAIHSYYALPE